MSRTGKKGSPTPGASRHTTAPAAPAELPFNMPILYPQSCKEVTDEMHVDELIRRLKVLASSFQSMGQEVNAYDEYVPLCLHLAEDGFLKHASKDVRLLIACCMADILRIYAPEAPYKDSEQVKTIFKFLISQLEGLKDPKDPAFKRYFYLLENLAYVKSFNMCFELEDAQEIFCALFGLIFQIVNDEHSGKVKAFMLDVLSPLITECDTVSSELLNIIMMNIVEPVKTSKKNAYHLAKELIVKCSETLEPYIQNFFNQVLICGKEDQTNLQITQKVYDLIYELNHICPSILLSVIPQLEYKLKSTDEAERLGSVSLLARMFSEKESSLATHHPQLWQAFLGRFNDISIPIRIKCVQYSMHFLLNHSELRGDIVETLRSRQHDGEENVRFEVVKAIVALAKLDFSVVSESEDLLSYVKERIMDKKFKIRREALNGLALIYKTHLTSDYVPDATRGAVTWIKDKILHAYYMSSLDDRILVERLLNSCLVPFNLPSEERMLKLLYLFGTIDEHASKAFVEIQKNLLLVRQHVGEMLKCIKNFEGKGTETERRLSNRITQLTKFLPDPVKGSEFLCRLARDLKQDNNLMATMDIIVSPQTDCKTCADSVTLVLKKLGAPVMTNLYYNTIKILLQRMSSVLIDRDALIKLLSIIHSVRLENQDVLKSLGMQKDVAIERGLRLINVLAFLFPSHFAEEQPLNLLVRLLTNVSENLQPIVLSALNYIGKAKPIGQYQLSLMGLLVPHCQTLVITGTPKQAKEAIRCIFTNMSPNVRIQTFTQIVDAMKANLEPGNTSYRTSIVGLGHIAFLMPDEFRNEMKGIVSHKLVKDLLVNPPRTEEDRDKNVDPWCELEDLPEITLAMIAGLKATVRWLLGLRNDVKSATKTFKMLTAFVETGGAFINSYVEFSNAEMAWLRLSAGAAMLKICEQKGVGDQFTASQFCTLSKLMNDELVEVRGRFAAKLHRGLSRGIPHKCLPLDFMGFYALSGYETDRKQKQIVRNYMIADVTKRRDYIKSLMAAMTEKAAEQLPHIMPDYMLVFSVAVLTHNPVYPSFYTQSALTDLKDCLWFILEPLIVKNENYSFGFYKSMIERMKNHLNALEPESEPVNYRMYTLCDIALGLILQRSTSFEMKEYPSDPRIPPMYFRRHEDPYFVNNRAYLPSDMQYAAPKMAGLTVSVVSEKRKLRKGKSSNAAVLDEDGNVSIDAMPMDAEDTRLDDVNIQADDGEPVPKVPRLTRRTAAAAAAAASTTSSPTTSAVISTADTDADVASADAEEEPSQPDSETKEEDSETTTPSSSQIQQGVRVTRRTAAAAAASAPPTPAQSLTTTVTVTLGNSTNPSPVNVK